MKRASFAAPSPSPRASRDRWLFGYADIVTLLFACFASLYAAELEPAAPTAPAAATAVAGAAMPSLLETLSPLGSLSADLPGFEVSAIDRGVVLSFVEAGSFPTGQAELTPEARRVLASVAEALRGRTNPVRVEGHTDDVPIHTARFGSNWELSSARATTVVQFLIAEGGLPASRLSAAGYADQRPRLPNDSAEARARNRRVDLVVLEERIPGSEAGFRNPASEPGVFP